MGFSFKLIIFSFFPPTFYTSVFVITVAINNSLIILDSTDFFQEVLMKPCRNQINPNFAEGCKENTCTLKSEVFWKSRDDKICHAHSWVIELMLYIFCSCSSSLVSKNLEKTFPCRHGLNWKSFYLKECFKNIFLSQNNIEY